MPAGKAGGGEGEEERPFMPFSLSAPELFVKREARKILRRRLLLTEEIWETAGRRGRKQFFPLPNGGDQIVRKFFIAPIFFPFPGSVTCWANVSGKRL